ncbi:MAG: hypothetical protein WCL39_15945, partial [Armatimonadota bacterium]
YSFEKKDMEVGARMFRLAPGTYELTTGPDDDNDWLIDKVQFTRLVTIAHRGDSLTFQLPPKRGWIMSLKQRTEIPVRSQHPADLAIAPRDVVRSGNSIRVTVHNIGGENAGPFAVRAINSSTGRIAAKAAVKALACPADLVPKTVTVTLRLPKGTTADKVVVDYRAQEITDINNSVQIGQ